MPKNLRYLSIIAIITFQVIALLASYALSHDDNRITFAYVTDLNLHPTPMVSQREKSSPEKRNGLLVHESQAIFQDIIRHINQKLNLDAVVFGGNNVAFFSDKTFKEDKLNSTWQLFQEMVGELKPEVFFVLGQNEMKSLNTDEIIDLLRAFGVNSENLWWSHEIKNYLFVGLNDSFIFNDVNFSKKQEAWLKKTLAENKAKNVILFLHESVLTPDGKPINNNKVAGLLKVINENKHIVLVLSGGNYLNRMHKRGNTLFVTSSSPIAYPCFYKVIEIDDYRIRIRTLNIGLKGIIKKSEQSLTASDYALKLFPSSPKQVKSYVKGVNADLNADWLIKDLKNR